ncbi:MAG: bifunctional DNA primase/polymerase [Dehalococcoidales bacterium]|nr:bifunctional DNA primase/polymerase [Dehalococcoidales bacterium]
MDNLNIALACTRRGWSVFPCRQDKRPITPRGFLDATRDTIQIDNWWKRNFDALVGIACITSGIFAVDVDDPHSWESLVDEHASGKWTRGPAQLTPGGGFHLIFKQPQGIEIPNNAGVIAKGIDLRSRGYICTGLPYTWLDDEGIYKPLVDAPEWLLKIIINKTHKENKDQKRNALRFSDPTGPAVYFLNKYIRAAFPGNRNQQGFLLAAQLRDCGLSMGEAENYMRQYARSVPNGIKENPYTESEALQSLRSAFSQSPRDPIQGGYTYAGI